MRYNVDMILNVTDKPTGCGTRLCNNMNILNADHCQWHCIKNIEHTVY